MPVDLNNAAPIDPGDPALAPMLANLQGNVLKGHGRQHTVHVFIAFNGTPEQTRPALAAVAATYVTSAQQQLIETDEFKRFGLPGKRFGGLFLTAKGYQGLGLTPAQIAAAFPETPGDPANLGIQSNFAEGMAAHGDEMNDPPDATWDPGYGGRRIDAMLLIADNDKDFLLREARLLVNQLEAFSTVLAVETGGALFNEAGDGIEHFGYVDGRSQPIYLASDIADEGGTDVWNPFEPLARVLVPDGATAEPDSFGSFFTFRKLEQDVLHFKLREQELADALHLTGSDRERAGAMAVGRFEDGTPLVLSPVDGFLPSKDNNFKYVGSPNPAADDAGGSKCPFQAHIRKVNPRGDLASRLGLPEATVERSRRVTRRGIPYGERKTPPDAFQALEDLPTGGVGLLFMCYGASIAGQFAFLQARWANNEAFVQGGVGRDTVMAETGAAGPTPQSWQAQYGPTPPPAAPTPFDFGGFVTLKGGEFFFAPSLPFLHGLAAAVV